MTRCPNCGNDHDCTYKANKSVVVRDSEIETHVESVSVDRNDCKGKHICRFCGIEF